jgi:CDP-diacylglycerol---glycerol-3-phosphate 3-phosphatidyltransferase
MFDGRFKTQIERYVRPIGESLRRTGLSPDHFTVLGLCVAAASAVAIGAGKMQLGLLLVICSALPDLLDGALAKASNSASQRGAFFDSVVDRVSDSFLFGGVAWFYASSDTPQFSIVPFAILGASLIISYERAKAESLGLYAKGGLMERAERIILLCFGLLFDSLLKWGHGSHAHSRGDDCGSTLRQSVEAGSGCSCNCREASNPSFTSCIAQGSSR